MNRVLAIVGLILCIPFYVWIIKSFLVDLPKAVYVERLIKTRGNKVIAMLKAVGVGIITIVALLVIWYWLCNSSSDAGDHYQEYTERREPGW